MGFQNIGPNYWKGEEGRLALIDGTGKFTDPHYVRHLGGACQVERRICPRASRRSPIRTRSTYFTTGQAAIYPAGSWDIAFFESQGDLDIGRLPPAGA